MYFMCENLNGGFYVNVKMNFLLSLGRCTTRNIMEKQWKGTPWTIFPVSQKANEISFCDFLSWHSDFWILNQISNINFGSIEHNTKITWNQFGWSLVEETITLRVAYVIVTHAETKLNTLYTTFSNNVAIMTVFFGCWWIIMVMTIFGRKNI